MKKFLIIVLMIGMIFAVGNTTFAYPTSVTVDSNNDGGTSYSDGYSLYFETGYYKFSVKDDDSSWNSYGGASDYWVWNVNIYWEDPSDSSNKWEVVLGDSSYWNNKKAANDNHQNDYIEVYVPVASNVWFYINDTTTFNNTGRVSMNIAVVPEPVSSTLFVIGSIMFAGRRYLGRRKGIFSRNYLKIQMEDKRV